MPVKEYKFTDLYLGMTVKESELSKIYNKYFILRNTRLLDDNDVEGELVYIDNGDKEEFISWFKQSDDPITPVYFDKEELMDGIVYDE